MPMFGEVLVAIAIAIFFAAALATIEAAPVQLHIEGFE